MDKKIKGMSLLLGTVSVLSLCTMDCASAAQAVNRSNGNYERGIFFAGANACYEVNIQDSSTVSSGNADLHRQEMICFHIGDTETEVPIVNGKASLPIERGQEGWLEISGSDVSGNAVSELRDYIISEDSLPVISYEVLRDAEQHSVRLVIEETGGIISGVRNYQCFLDGKTVVVEKVQREEKELGNGALVCYKVWFEIPLGDMEGHELVVRAEDNCSNQAEKVILTDGIQKDGISVVLPTDISLMMFNGAENIEGSIQSQDIVLINKSAFPVGVKVNQIAYEIEESEEEQKECQLAVRIREYNKEESCVAISENEGMEPVFLQLEEGRESTDAKALLQKAAEWNPIGSVLSPDYGVLRLEGTLGKGNWRDGDVKVNVVFEFERVN